MSTAASSTDAAPVPEELRRRLIAFRGTVNDLRALVAFRRQTLRGRARRAAQAALVVLLVVTVAAGWLPAYLPPGHRGDVLVLLPSAMVGILVLAVLSATASGGGRELIPHDQGVAFPVGPTADHLGALAQAPLNIAWLLQAWTILGATAYVAGASPALVLAQVVVVLWLVAATAVGQLVGWWLEWLRRGPHGTGLIRLLLVAAAGAVALLVSSGRLAPLLDRSPTVALTIGSLRAAQAGRPTAHWALLVGLLVLVVAVAVVTGALMCRATSRRPARDTLRLETSRYAARRNPGSDLRALLRTDRVGIWRSVPLRRGLAVLALMPGLVAVAGDLRWDMLTILPGLVASGGALLFGVNSWCLDGRGALWRESLPVPPGMVLLSRALVLSEVLLVATAGTIVLASVRAGLPNGSELVAVACASLVVVLQVVSASLRWSVRRPYPVDLRSARATPAPPLVMVGYSARLALSTTFVGLFFSVLARVGPGWSLACALPLLLLSGWRLARTARAWTDPATRCAVITTVAS